MTGRRLGLALLVAATAIALVGCGGDRFAGTWTTPDGGGRSDELVIAKTTDGYRLAFVDSGSVWLPLTQSGDTLKFTYTAPEGTGAKADTGWVSLTCEDGVLVYRESAFGDVPMARFKKVRDRTAIPTQKSGE